MSNIKASSSGGHRVKRERKDNPEEEDDLIEEEGLLTAVTPDEGDRDTCKTFLFKGEGHTLGNPLRFVVSTYPEVLFCAYTLPHPAEDVMHFRIQTTPGILPQDILERGLHDLLKLSEIVIEKFEEAVSNAPPPVAEEDSESHFPSKSESVSRTSSKGNSLPKTANSKAKPKSKSNVQDPDPAMTRKFQRTTISVIETPPQSTNTRVGSEGPESVDLSDQ